MLAYMALEPTSHNTSYEESFSVSVHSSPSEEGICCVPSTRLAALEEQSLRAVRGSGRAQLCKLALHHLAEQPWASAEGPAPRVPWAQAAELPLPYTPSGASLAFIKHCKRTVK